MKSYIDFFETLKGEFIASLKFKNKFIKLWGTHTLDGIEVLNDKFYLSPGFDTQKVQSFLKHIGAQKSYNSGSFKGTTSYYFWLNATKADTLSQEGINDIIASKINSYCTVGEKLKINLNFTHTLDYNYFKGFTKQQIFDYVASDYDAMYNTLDNYAVGETLLTTTIGSYILFDNGQHFDVTILNAGVSAVPYKSRSNAWDDEYITTYKAGISIEIEASRRDNITGSASIVTHIVDEAYEHSTAIQQLLESSENEKTGTGLPWIKNRKKKTDDIWYDGKMRLSFLDDSSIKTKEKIKILLSSLDTGYTQKKAKWYKKILGPVLIIIAIVVTVVTAGAGAGVGAFLTSLAINVGIATLTMTALSIYWSKHGDPAAASYMGRWIKVGSIISAVAGITAIIANIARQAATQAATTAATEAAIENGGTQYASGVALGNEITIGATNIGGGLTVTETFGVNSVESMLSTQTVQASLGNYVSTSWNIASSAISNSFQSMASTGLKMVRFFTNMRFQSQAKSLQSEINAKTEQNDKASQELEEMNDKEVNIAVEDIKWYTSPLKLESQRYDVDYLYGGTKFNIGRPSFCTGRGSNIISNDVYDVNKI